MQVLESQARRIINALKTGVIPDTDLDLLCIGRDKAVREFGRCLDLVTDNCAQVKFLAGEYGSGKSFMLGKIRQMAVRRNFAVSRVQLGRNIHLNNPDIFYYTIMHNLAVESSDTDGTDFEGLFDKWLEKLKSGPSREWATKEIRSAITSLDSFNSSFARAFLAYIKARISGDSELSRAASSWIKGEKNLPASVKAMFEIKGDIGKAESFDLLKAFIHLLKLVGYNGLVILADELETVMGLRSDIRMGCYENLRLLVDSCGDGGYKNCLFVFAGTDKVFDDPEKGLKTYPALYQRIGGAEPGAAANMQDMRKPVINLKRLDNDDLLVVSGRIMEVHKTAYGWIPHINCETARNWTLLTLSKEKGGMLPVNTREFIIKLIEILDILEQNPGYNLYNTELKMVNRNGIDMFVNVLPRKATEE